MEITSFSRVTIESEQNDRKLIEEVARLFNKLLMIHTFEEVTTEIKICKWSKPKIRTKE